MQQSLNTDFSKIAKQLKVIVGWTLQKKNVYKVPKEIMRHKKFNKETWKRFFSKVSTCPFLHGSLNSWRVQAFCTRTSLFNRPRCFINRSRIRVNFAIFLYKMVKMEKHHSSHLATSWINGIVLNISER